MLAVSFSFSRFLPVRERLAPSLWAGLRELWGLLKGLWETLIRVVGNTERMLQEEPHLVISIKRSKRRGRVAVAVVSSE